MSLRLIVRSLALSTAIAAGSGFLALPASAQADAGKRTVNINQASADELARLPRVGVKLGGRIVAHRTQHGPFKRVEDLMAVKGVGEKMFANLRPYLAVSGTTTLTEKVSSKGSGSASSKTPSARKGGKKAAGGAKPAR